MSIFSETKLNFKISEQINLVEVSHTSSNSSIALTTMNKILLFAENGEKHDYELARSITPTAICWHPSQPLLAIGWENGTVTLWQEDTKMPKEETSVHKYPVNIIKFNPGGTRMVSADTSGLVVVWRGLTVMCQYQKEGVMTHCIFCDLSQIIKTSNLFFFGGQQGVVCLADDSKHCSDVCKVGGSIKSLLIYEKENSVIIITSSLLLVQFKISITEKTAPDKKVKLSIAGEAEQLQSIWIGSCLLATSSYENMIRMWHLENDDNYVLTLHSVQEWSKNPNESLVLNDKITTIAYEEKGKLLIAGTKDGRLLFWKNLSVVTESPVDSEQWKTMPFLKIGKQVQTLSVGKTNQLIIVKTAEGVSVVTETLIKGKMTDNIKALQTDAKRVLVQVQVENHVQQTVFESKHNIKSLDVSGNLLMTQGSKKIEIFEVVPNPKGVELKPFSSIELKCFRAAFQGENLFMFTEYALQISNNKGVVKQNLAFSEGEGKTNGFCLMNKTLVQWTSYNYIRVLDLSRRDVRQVGNSRKFEDATGLLGDIKYCAVNCDGTKIGIIGSKLTTVAQNSNNNQQSQSNCFYIYDSELDNFSRYNLANHQIPIDIYFDQTEPRFFGVLTQFSKTNISQDDENIFKGNTLLTFFYTTQTGVKPQDEYHMTQEQEGVFAIKIPYLYYIARNTSEEKDENYVIQPLILKDFQGLEKTDDLIQKAIINFSFHLSTGNLDEAYKSVKSISNPVVWEKMAQMSVRMKRLDVAEICIGNMKFARGNKAIRESKTEDQLEAQLAMVALQLGMKEEAEKLYFQCKRYDLLNKMYQASGEWDKAIEISEKHDRINLRTTYYKTAKMHEVSQNYEKAIFYFEKSNTHLKEIPRMYLDRDMMDELQQYVDQKKEKELYKWWANYEESQSNIDEAIRYYKLADDQQSQVRLLIHSGDVRTAKEICNIKSDPAACLVMAKYQEINNNINEAISYYARAQYFTMAIRLAKERNLDSDVMSLSLQGPKQIMVQSAIYFEQKGLIEKAVVLFMKGGQLKRALTLAQKQKLFDYVKKIQSEIAEAEYLETQKAQQQKQVQKQNNQPVSIPTQGSQSENSQLATMINNKQFDRALEYCVTNNISITEDMTKKMLDDDLGESKKRDLTLQIAENAKKMGNYELASKLFIQIGDRVKAVKCLIKVGDVDKVIAFANNARIPEIYIFAGNFLQQGDWHKNPDLMKHIIGFYSKAKAFDHLSTFFDSCATVEIDEYRDYDKASAAIREAIKHIQKSTSADKDSKLQQLTAKQQMIDYFIQTKNLFETNPQQMVGMCEELLRSQHVDYYIRSGDVFALCIEYFYSIGNMGKAHEYMTRMQRKGIVLNPFIDQQIIQEVMKAVEKHDDDKPFQEEMIDDDQ